MLPAVPRPLFWTLTFNLVRPSQNAALQVPNLAEPGLAQEIDGLCRALTAAAMRDDLARAIELVHAPRQIPQRNQMAAQVTNLVFMRLAHVENENFVATVQSSLQLARGDFGDLRCGRRSFLAANTAELFVVNQLGDGAVLSANRASGILAQLELAEAHSERIEQEQAAHQGI